jgi:hypothetical protein
MGFDPYNCPLKIWKCIRTPTPKVGTHLGVWGFIPSHSLALLGSWMWLLGSLLACTFTSLCLDRKSKARVATLPLFLHLSLLWKWNMWYLCILPPCLYHYWHYRWFHSPLYHLLSLCFCTLLFFLNFLSWCSTFLSFFFLLENTSWRFCHSLPSIFQCYLYLLFSFFYLGL